VLLLKIENMSKKVRNCFPLPIPDVTGSAADKFMEQINKPPTQEHLEKLKEAEETYAKIKRVK